MKKLLFGFLATMLALGVDASPVVHIQFAQNGGASELYLDITNPDFTYDSAQVKFDELFNPVAQYVKSNNFLYSDKTLDEIKGEWGIAISSDGEVYTGWSAGLNGGLLDLTNQAGKTTDFWNSTLDNSSQDWLRLAVNFNNQLDINHNSQFDPELEQLTWDGPLVNGAVTGYDAIGNDVSTNVNQVGVVPEPATMTMLGLAGLLIAAKRRFFS